MIKYTTGNIFDSDASTWVCPTNQAGVSGAGLALQFKKKFPTVMQSWEDGPTDTPVLITVPYGERLVHICCFPTKVHWKQDADIDLITRGLDYLADLLSKDSYKEAMPTIAFPKIGCGLGRLSWEDTVKPLIEEKLGNIPGVTVVLVE